MHIYTLHTKLFQHKDWTKEHEVNLIVMETNTIQPEEQGIAVSIVDTPIVMSLREFMNRTEAEVLNYQLGDREWLMFDNGPKVREEILAFIGLKPVTADTPALKPTFTF